MEEQKGIDIFNFVSKHLGEHKIRGKEIKVKTCPFCGRKEKFSINYEKGFYQCFSGHCREVGSIGMLYRKYGLIDYTEYNPKQNNELKGIMSPITKEAKDFFLTRKITEKTIVKNYFDIFSTKDNKISFIYRKIFDVNLVKIRTTEKKCEHYITKKIKDLCLWKLDYCDYDLPLVICEGELDQLSFEEQGFYNAVSVPSGAGSLGWIDTEFSELEKFKEIVLCFDMDKAGQDAVKKIIPRLPENCIVKVIDFGTLEKENGKMVKDANDIHMLGLNLMDYVNNAKILEIEEYVKMIDIDIHTEEEKFSTGSINFNKDIGCLRTGEVTIYTGSAGSGKSTVLMQMAIEVMEQEKRVLIYTPELKNSQFKRWTVKQMLGENLQDKLLKKYDAMEDTNKYEVKKEYTDKMSLWLDKRMNLISSNVTKSKMEMIKTIKRDIKRYNSKFIIIDNLMKIQFDDTNLNEEQKDFVSQLSDIAKNFNVSINLVAHPKKHDMNFPNQYDVSGSSNMTNLVDNIYYFRRLTDSALEQKPFSTKAQELRQKNISCAMIVLKSREGKKIGDWIWFTFDIQRKRITHHLEAKEHFNNKWETEKEIIDPDEEKFFKLMEQF